MYAFFEVNDKETRDKGDDTIIKTHTSIQSLSWMNKTNRFAGHSQTSSASTATATSGATTSANANNNNNNSSIEDQSHTEESDYTRSNNLKFKKFLNQQEGWLATGNSNSMVGCTFTTCLSEQQYDYLKVKESNVNTTNKQGDPTTELPSEKETPTETAIPTNTAENSQSSSQAQQSTGSSITSTGGPAQPKPSLSNANNLNRTNFNLRGHKHDVKLVRWNEPYQKLASCDSKGLIYVWVKYEGRWSIELINDRGNCVSDFAWSHDGRMAVICYQDGFVLVGSVNGQRFWSHLYDLPSATITSATWTPNDAYVLLGLSNGNLMVVDENGTIITRYNLKNDCILSLTYNSPKFFINDELNASSLQSFRFRLSASNNNNNNANNSNAGNVNNNNAYNNENKIQLSKNNKIDNSSFILACLFKSNGVIYLLRSYDDLDPIIIETKLEGIKFEWSSCGKILAVGGHQVINKNQTESDNNPKGSKNQTTDNQQQTINSYVQFYNQQGNLIYKVLVPTIKDVKEMNKNSIVSQLDQLQNQKKSSQHQQESKLDQKFSALTWGHNDQRLFVACSSTLHILRVHKEIPTLNILAQMCIKTHCTDPVDTANLDIPTRFEEKIKYCYQSTVKSVYPKLSKLRTFVCNSLPNNERLHCTLKRVKVNSKYDYYVLYLEYLGGLIPLLTAKKSSKLKPDFVVFDPFLGCEKIAKKNNKRIGLVNNNTSAQDASGAIHKVSETTRKPKTRWNRLSSSKSKSQEKQSILYNEFSKANANELEAATSSTRYKPANRRLKLTSLTVNKRLFRQKSSQKEGSGGVAARKSKKTSTKKTGVHPNKKYLVQIMSNIWGTKFKFFGQNFLQSSIGQITYKTSLFHLQPRQMKIVLEDLSQMAGKTDELTEEEEMPQVLEETTETVPVEESLKPLFIEDCQLTQSIQSLNEIKQADSTLSLDLNADKKSLKNLISIKTSATLGAIPDIMAIQNSCDLGSIGTASSPQISKSSSHKEFGSYEFSGATCNDEIATVQELVEHKFSYNASGNFFEKFHLPILTLVDNSFEVEDYAENNNLITSQAYFVEEEAIDMNASQSEEIHLLAATSTKSLSVNQSSTANQALSATTGTQSLTTTIYPKNHLKTSKFNLFSRFNRNGGDFLFSSSQLFNFLLNRKVLEKTASEYEKLKEESKKDFTKSSSKTKPKSKNTTASSEKTTQSQPKDLDESGSELKPDEAAISLEPAEANKKSGNLKRVRSKKRAPSKNQFILQNKPPIWNETNQVYQLDFGGRVTQESAKNFQIEFAGKQVMQFGRIDPNSYTLDFEWPFTAVQAFSIALANITQRFK